MDPVSTLAAHSADGGAALATPATEPDEPARVLLPMPVYVRSVSLALLAVRGLAAVTAHSSHHKRSDTDAEHS